MGKQVANASILLALFLVACDDGGPRLLSVFPAGDAQGVALDTSVEVRFDQPVQFVPNRNPVTLSLDGEEVDGVLSIGAGGGPVLFTPRRFLIAGRTYQATLGPGLETLGGKGVSVERTWQFTTVTGCEMEKSEESQLATGPDGKGGFIIPGGRRVTPLGDQLDLDSFPTNLAVSPDGSRLVVTNNGHGQGSQKEQSLTVVDPNGPTEIQSIRRPRPQALFYGLAYTSDGSRLYASGGESNVVEVFDVNPDGTLADAAQFDVNGFPAGLLLDESGNRLFVAAQNGGDVVALDPVTGEQLWKTQVGLAPYDFVMDPTGTKLYVSIWGRTELYDPGRVLILEPATGTVLERIEVGKNPEDLLLAADGRLFVACSDADRVDVIDTGTDRVADSWTLRPSPGDPVGLSPVALALDPARSRLYVACAQKNSVDVLSLIDGSHMGSIPTAWYPTAVTLSRDGTRLYVVNGKGVGTGPLLEPVDNATVMHGTLSVLPVPGDEELDDLTRKVKDNNFFALGFFPDRCLGKAFPLPRAIGEPSPIKHVIFVLRENKTYDQNLGDLEGTNADPSLVMFGETYTPNLHALAREFCNLDNFHVEVEVSVQGHYWTAASTLNDFAEKAWQANYRDDGRMPALGLKQIDYPAGLFIWHKMEEAGIDFRNYGEPYGLAAEYSRFEDHVNMEYMWDLGENLYSTPETQRVEMFLQEVDQDIFPPFVYLSLLNDHTYGRTPGQPTPGYMVAENDYATGLLVDRISHSEYWPETLIIVTEDDPQSGLDHVDLHRSIALLISPYTKRGYTSSVHHGFSSLIRTYGLILGMPALNILDETAAPVYDCFTSTPDFSTYTVREQQIPYEENPHNVPGADESLRMDFSAPDRAEGLGKVLWMATRPGEPIPLPFLEEEKEEGEERMIMPVPLGPLLSPEDRR
jgi:DNA-binding beta-propeller fold protein YncE